VIAAADLIVMGVEVLGDCPEDESDLAVQCAAYDRLHDCIMDLGVGCHRTEIAGLVLILEMLQGGANAAADMHDGAPDVSPVTIARMRRFSAAMSAALKEIA
jgi:hypothetical protein